MVNSWVDISLIKHPVGPQALQWVWLGDLLFVQSAFNYIGNFGSDLCGCKFGYMCKYHLFPLTHQLGVVGSHVRSSEKVREHFWMHRPVGHKQ